MSDVAESSAESLRTSLIALADALPLAPARERAPLAFHTVAVGASAGGVEAMMQFFGAMPADSGCAFLVVMHLQPDRESMLASLIGRTTSMPVAQAVADTLLQRDHVYIAPPGRHLELADGRIQLPPIGPRGPKATGVDHCMISLAADQGERAIGIVLTGMDSDGSIGIKAVKAEGGFTIAQRPSEAAHPDMPRSALATGLVDCDLAIEDMAAAITDYVAADRGRLGAADGAPDADEPTLHEVLDVVRAQLGRDFRGYKPAMLLRRVARRMGLTRTTSMQRFAALIKEDAGQAKALADDFLISVTEFFREPAAWSALAEDALPALLAGKAVGDSVRVWVPACATGEEAYSLAMVLLECDTVRERGLKLQIFATDIDDAALETARRGSYPLSIDKTVSAARLQRFFLKSATRYQVRKDLRDTVVFAGQNVVSDPPFSRMDIVSCRNLLIYMGAELQGRMLQVFHFALEPGGILALGKSETVGAQAPLFVSASQRAHLYRRIGPARAVPIAAPPPTHWKREDPGQAKMPHHPLTDYARVMRDALLDQRVAAAVVVDHHGNALYFYGAVHAYLLQPEGVPTTDLFAMLRDELRPQLRAAIHKAHDTRERAETTASMHVADHGEQQVRLAVSALPGDPRADMLVITFERVEPRADLPPPSTPADAAALYAIEDELRTTRHELRAAIEELESANEELKVANEEAMSMNEELQSANEELETSKEEVQSINEELTTVNQQLESKVTELEVLNNDLGNLLTSTHIPTLFLDRRLRIKRFTPAANLLFPLLPSDLNRPLSDIAGPNDLASLLDDARQVLARLTPIDRETVSADGHHFLRRTLPYRTQEDRIDGVVVTFSDITALKTAGESLRRHAAVMLSSVDAIIVHDLDGRILAWNRGAQAMYGYPEAEMLGAEMNIVVPPQGRRAHALLLERVRGGERAAGVEGCRRRQDGALLDVSIACSLIRDDAGKAVAVALTERDISPQKRAETTLRESEERFRMLANSAPALIWMADEFGALEFVNEEFARVSGNTGEQLVGRWWVDLLHHDDAARVAAGLPELLAGRTDRLVVNARLRIGASDYRWMKVTLMQRGSSRADAILSRDQGTVGTMVDIDAQVRAEAELRDASQHKDEFLAMLGHELRNPLVPIRNAAEILGKVGGEDRRIHWVRETLVRQVEHVTRLVDDLLDISLMTRNTMRLHREPVDIVSALESAIESTAPLINRKRHRFELAIALEGDSAWVEGDSIRLTQIFENLLANAAKYTDEAGLVQVELRVQGPQVQVEVRDNGLGIDPRLAGRIFELFVQDHRSLDRSQGGMGIGLALVRHLVHLHGGSVEAFSEGLNRGSRFVVRLPLLGDVHAHDDAPTAAAAPSERGRVLIVDDDEHGAESLAMLLELSGHEVRAAANLDEALRVARELRPEIALLDIGMPVADGYEVARRLRALPQMPAQAVYMALTGFGRPEDFTRSARESFFRHLVKPVDPAALESALQEALVAARAPEAS